MLANIPSEYDTSVGSFYYDNLKAVDIEMDNIDSSIADATSKLDISNLTGDELTQRVYERTGLTRKLATYATTTVNIVGTSGAAINTGDKVSSDTVNFTFQESKLVDTSGQANVQVQCEIAGSSGNVPVGAIKYFPITLSGLTSVTNLEAVTNGYDAESDADLLERYYEKIQTPSKTNNKAQYKSWAEEVTGVGDAIVFSLWNGDNTVKVVIIDSNKQPAGSDLVTQVQEYIDPGSAGTGDGTSGIGNYCTVESATGKTINVTFTADKDPAVTDADRLTNVTKSINDYFKSIAYKDTQVSYAKISSFILASSGILDISNLLVNGGTANISISQVLPTVETPVLGGVTIA